MKGKSALRLRFPLQTARERLGALSSVSCPRRLLTPRENVDSTLAVTVVTP
jgi:hypothetical protein